MAGGHPYLLQVAASALWESYDDTSLDASGRWREVPQTLLDETPPTLRDIWPFWAPGVRRACIDASQPTSALVDRDGRAQPDRYNVPAIRSLIRDAFTDRTLRHFCADRRSLAGVVSSFASEASLEDMIDVLVEHCQKQLLVGELLAGIREANTRQYQRYESQLVLHDVPAGAAMAADLGFLVKAGLVVQDEVVPGGWRVRPLVFFWWLTLDLIAAASSLETLRAWLSDLGKPQSPVQRPAISLTTRHNYATIALQRTIVVCQPIIST